MFAPSACKPTVLCLVFLAATASLFPNLAPTTALAGPSLAPSPVAPSTPYELGVVRGTRIVAQSLAVMADVSRWGRPVPPSARADESFRRRSSVLQLTYSHWGYMSAVKTFVDNLSAHISANITANVTIARSRTLSVDTQLLLSHFAGELRVLGNPRHNTESIVQDGVYLLGNEAYAATLMARGKYWSSRFDAAYAHKDQSPSVLSRLNRMFINKPLPGADVQLERMRREFGERSTNSDYDVGLLHGSRALILASSTAATSKAMKQAFLAYRSLRNDARTSVPPVADDDEVMFFDEDYQESWVGSRPYVEFQLGYAQALSEINSTLDQLLSTKVVAQLNLKDKKERQRFLQEWALASAALKGTAATCSPLLEPLPQDETKP